MSHPGVCEKCGAAGQKLIPVDRDDFALFTDDKLQNQMIEGWRIVRLVCYGCCRGAKQIKEGTS